MADGYPDEIVLLYRADTGDAAREPLAAPAAALQKTADTFVGAPQSTFVGPGALAAAARPAADRSPSLSANVTIDLGGETTSLGVTPDTVEDVLIALYTAGGWEWVQHFLFALGREVFPVDMKAVSASSPLQAEAPANADIVKRRVAFADAVSKSLVSLNGLIVDVLVEFSERGLALAQSLAVDSSKKLATLKRAYGIRLKPDVAQADSSGAGGGTGTTGGGSGAEGGPGTSQTQYEVRDAEIPGAAADLLAAIKALSTAYSAVATASAADKSTAQAPSTPYATTNEGAPADTGGEAAGGGPPTSGQPDPPSLPDAVKRFQEMFRATTAQHRIAPGVLALCMSERKGATGEIEDNVIYGQIAQYFDTADMMLGGIPVSSNSQRMRDALARSLYAINDDLRINLQDTPEVRAAVWAGRDDRSGSLEPLLADQLLERVRADIVSTAHESGDEAEVMRAAFAVAVLNGFLRSADARDLVRAARLAKAERAMADTDKGVATLSLIGLLVPPIGRVTQLIALYSLYGHAMNQLVAIASINAVMDVAALDALLADDAASFGTTLASKPRADDILGQILAETGLSLVQAHAINTFLPSLGLAMQVVTDVDTLTGPDSDGNQ